MSAGGNILFYPAAGKISRLMQTGADPSKGTILLVEDNPDDEALTLRAFKKNNIANPVVVVHDGVEALEYLFGTGPFRDRDITDLPVMVMLDLKLPRLDGMDVLRRIRQDARTRLLPVVILTSSNEESDIVRGYAHGANSYVCKPVEMEAFIRAVGQVGVYWLSVNESPH